MLRIVALAVLAVALHAQDSAKPAEKPPAKADQALRIRANQFYQDFVKGQFTDAETLVAPEVKDLFISTHKEHFVSCELKSVTYSDKFRLADVGVTCERNIMFQGFVGHPMKYPEASQWKLEHGKWYWWVDPNAPQPTPFGMINMMKAMTGAAGAGATAAPPASVPSLPSSAVLTSPAVALHKVAVDRQSIVLRTGESGEVTFTNSALGPMSVSLSGVPPDGFQVTPTHADMQKDGKATITVKALEGAKAVALHFQVMPTGEDIAVQVSIP